ncbi:hypothetical protein Tco_1373659, partial [Tanacetum coccineum]
MLFRDRRYHLHTAMLLESKARHARQAWSHAMKCNRAVHDELLTYRAEGHDRTREPDPARDPEPQNGPADAGSSYALAEYEEHRSSGNGDDSHDSRSGRRIERAAEFVFHISNCTIACQIKFATCTLLGNALTWWNSHIKTIGHDAAYGMPWKTLKKMMTDKYCQEARSR